MGKPILKIHSDGTFTNTAMSIDDVPVNPSYSAVIVSIPVAVPAVTSPLLLTEADVPAELHTASSVMSSVVLSLNVAVAVSWTVSLYSRITEKRD